MIGRGGVSGLRQKLAPLSAGFLEGGKVAESIADEGAEESPGRPPINNHPPSPPPTLNGLR